MAGPGSPQQPPTTGSAAARRAVGMPAVTRGADGEQAVAVSAGLLAERLVHGVGARGASSDWTASTNRGTTAPTGSVCRSSGRSRGSGGTRALTPRLSPFQRYPNAPALASTGVAVAPSAQARAPPTIRPAVAGRLTAPRVVTCSLFRCRSRARLPHSANVRGRTFAPLGLLLLQKAT